MLGGNLGSLLYGDVSVMNHWPHYDNTPMQYTAISSAVKIDHLSPKHLRLFLLIFNQNVNLDTYTICLEQK